MKTHPTTQRVRLVASRRDFDGYIVAFASAAVVGAIFLTAPVAHADIKSPGNHNGPMPPATAHATPPPTPTPRRLAPGTNFCQDRDPCECIGCPVPIPIGAG
jgi:hypothetical protein